MRILILSQYYDPEPVEKVHDLAKGLSRMGHNVQVVTGFPCYPQGKIYEGYRQRWRSRERIAGIDVVRLPQFPDHSRSVVRRAIYYLSFVISTLTMGLLSIKPADVMIVYQSQLPLSFAAWIIGRLRRIPIILDVVDLWPESVIASGMIKNRWLIASIRRAARFIYHRVDHVNVVTRGFYRNLLALGVPPEKLSIIHNWLPGDIYEKRAHAVRALPEGERLRGYFNVMYAGNIGPSQQLETVIAAAERLQAITDVQFVFVGDGLDYDKLVALAEEKALSNVRFLGRYPPKEMPGLFAMADVLLAHLKPDPLSDVSIPSKIMAYMTSGKPILVAIRGEAETFVVEHNLGLTVQPSDPAALADAVRQLYRLPPAERAALGQAALDAYTHKFNSTVQVRRFAELCADVSRRKRDRRTRIGEE